jgi:hypothetical protein
VHELDAQITLLIACPFGYLDHFLFPSAHSQSHIQQIVNLLIPVFKLSALCVHKMVAILIDTWYRSNIVGRYD